MHQSIYAARHTRIALLFMLLTALLLGSACARVAPGQRHMLPVEEPGTVAAALRSFVSAHPAVANPAQTSSTQAHAAKA